MHAKSVISLVGALAMLSVAAPAHAYLDPGTGSIILQATIGAIAGATLFARSWIYKVKSIFSRSKPGDSK